MTSRRPPCPPLTLANRVCCLNGLSDPCTAYESLGAETKASILRMLPEQWSFKAKRVLDFGCGAGRTLRHFLSEAEHAEVWGADIDAASVIWLRENLSPPLKVLHNATQPPLGLEYGTFDLVWALSVFTHLTDNSIPWLLELHRLLKHDGLLIATYMGRWNIEVFTHEPWDENTIGMNVVRQDQGWEHGGPMVFMSDWWVGEHWGRAFEIVEVAPEIHGQTWVLLRKRNVELTRADLEQPADDPREYAALRHNRTQVERDREVILAELRQRHEAAIAEIRRQYEASWSWQLTRPLRGAGQLARAVGNRRRGS